MWARRSSGAPAAWVVVAIAVALFGLAPGLSGAAWGVYARFILPGEIGPLLELSQWVLDLSPYAHVPKQPGSEVDLLSVSVLTAVAVGLGLVGLVGLRRRDIG